MSKEKQIEEMARDLCECYNSDGTCYQDNKPCDFRCDELINAQYIYEKGYRKQSEGEWLIKSEIYKLIDDVDEELFVECSICQRRFNVPYELDDEKIFKYAREHYPYCNCGAKMKGGE